MAMGLSADLIGCWLIIVGCGVGVGIVLAISLRCNAG